MVVEEMDKCGWTTEIDKREAGWACTFANYSFELGVMDPRNMNIKVKPEIAHAICLAALEAVRKVADD